MKKYDYSKLKGDEQLTHNWAPLNFQIKDKGFVSISNHVHYLDCTLIGLIYYPRRVHYPTLEENFKIPVVRKIIRLLYAMPIPKERKKKDKFYSEIKNAFNNKFILHMYPEAAM